MGLFDFFKKKETNLVQKTADMNEIKNFSQQAVNFAISEIENTDSFLPFGGVVTVDNTFQMIVYQDPSKTTIDHREHATIIQKIIMEKYKERNNRLFYMAWDGVAHLPTGDIDCINVKVDDKHSDTHKMFMYTYTKIDGKVQITDIGNPTINDV